MGNLNTVWQVLEETQEATGASKRDAKSLKQERAQGLIEGNLSFRIQG